MSLTRPSLVRVVLATALLGALFALPASAVFEQKPVPEAKVKLRTGSQAGALDKGKVRARVAPLRARDL